MVSHLDNMNLPIDLSNITDDSIIQSHLRRFIETNRDSVRYPIGGDINEFFPLVHKALYSNQLANDVPIEKMVRFVEDDPPAELDTETITFYIQARNPGQYGQGPAGTQSHREVRHHIRNIKDHPDYPGEKIITLGKFYDNYIRFIVHARDNKTARQRLLWFTQTMDYYLWYFRMKGYLVIELGVGDRERIEIDGLEVTIYPVTYFVQSEDLRHISTQELKQVILSLEITSDST